MHYNDYEEAMPPHNPQKIKEEDKKLKKNKDH